MAYNKEYYKWQAPIGEFGGWANLSKFRKYTTGDQDVLDFGCGGGFLLKQLDCKTRTGIEVNPAAREAARQNGSVVYEKTEDVPDNSFDLIISNHALEHVHHPLGELKLLYQKLRVGGRSVFVVPCETIYCSYREDDINHHLYTWSPMCLGNLFKEAGFLVVESKPFMHKWRMKFRFFARFGGRWLFELASRLYGRIDRRMFQVRVVAEKGTNPGKT